MNECCWHKATRSSDPKPQQENNQDLPEYCIGASRAKMGFLSSHADPIGSVCRSFQPTSRQHPQKDLLKIPEKRNSVPIQGSWPLTAVRRGLPCAFAKAVISESITARTRPRFLSRSSRSAILQQQSLVMGLGCTEGQTRLQSKTGLDGMGSVLSSR